MTLRPIFALLGAISLVCVHSYSLSCRYRPLHSINSPIADDTTTEIGSGSYGSVSLLRQEGEQQIGKRAWDLQELREKYPTLSEKQLVDKHQRCDYYLGVEEHCYEKLHVHPRLPYYIGSQTNTDGHKWILFKAVTTETGSIAPSLDDILQKDWQDHHDDRSHHLELLSQELFDNRGDGSLAQTVTTVLTQLLEILEHLHSRKIVHRDIKPANLLVARGKVLLIDFGSAADLETAGFLNKNIGLSERVAISPIYAAPEVFIQDNLRYGDRFDCFSAGLLACQLLFQYLDERTDAGFHQQLKFCNFDLDLWLQTQLQAKIRPNGLVDGLEVLRDRPGLWSLLQDLLQEDPEKRISSRDALKRIRRIENSVEAVEQDDFLREVLESLESCRVDEDLSTSMVLPLHYVATFRRDEPLGLVLAEADAVNDLELDRETQSLWRKVQVVAKPGEVYIQGIVPGCQAESLGIFEIGDRLQGVGELPLLDGGFERAAQMIQDQPRKSKNLVLHFDRFNTAPLPVRSTTKIDEASQSSVAVAEQGAWSIQGRRQAQEDAYLLHRLGDAEQRNFLLAGVFDGHLGSAASSLASAELPRVLSERLFALSPLESLAKSAWNDVCVTYRDTCLAEDCAAEYDPVEGILKAQTGSKDAVAGTTASFVVIDEQNAEFVVLNCGDSRTIVIHEGCVIFQTDDHKPHLEVERFRRGQANGLDYSIPQCSFNRWTVPVGDYDYALSRALEGPFATSKGIVSDADVTTLELEPSITIISASDGLWDVMDPLEVAKRIPKLRSSGIPASDIAKDLCAEALRRGSADNVSVVLINTR